MAEPLTSRQREILEYLRFRQKIRSYPPTVREIGEAVGLSSSSTVQNHLNTLERKGYIRRDPTKRGSKVRRWLTYLTLFAAATALICDVGTLVYSLLGGEITGRFLLKVAVVALIAGSAFGYYLSDLRADETGGRS